MNSISIRSPKFDRSSIDLPLGTRKLDKPFNGTICSKEGDEYEIKDNIIDMIGTPGEGKTLAQASNHWMLTSYAYEDYWRTNAVSILSGQKFPLTREANLLAEWFRPTAGRIYLDVGCSTGLYGRMIVKKEPEAIVVGMDSSKLMLQKAREKCLEDKADQILLRADAENMPFFSKTFDGATMGGTLNEFVNPGKALYEVRRSLKDDSRFFIMHLLTAANWYNRIAQNASTWGGLKFWTQSESNKLFEKCGFKVVEQETRGMVCFSLLEPAL